MLDRRLQALLHDLEQLAPEDQQHLADQIEEWLDDREWRRILNEPGPDALYETAVEEIRRGETQPLKPEDFGAALSKSGERRGNRGRVRVRFLGKEAETAS